MFEEALRQLLALEGEGFRAEAQCNPMARETDIVVSWRPQRYHYVRSSVSDNALEDMRSSADYLVSVIEDSAARVRGAAIADIVRLGRPIAFRPGDFEPGQARGLVFGLLALLDAFKGMESCNTETIARRLVKILTNSGDSVLCEQLAIELMQHVERVPR